jgi:hypothetical protein
MWPAMACESLVIHQRVSDPAAIEFISHRSLAMRTDFAPSPLSQERAAWLSHSVASQKAVVSASIAL